jgi:hypothetical protein
MKSVDKGNRRRPGFALLMDVLLIVSILGLVLLAASAVMLNTTVASDGDSASAAESASADGLTVARSVIDAGSSTGIAACTLNGYVNSLPGTESTPNAANLRYQAFITGYYSDPTLITAAPSADTPMTATMCSGDADTTSDFDTAWFVINSVGTAPDGTSRVTTQLYHTGDGAIRYVAPRYGRITVG